MVSVNFRAHRVTQFQNSVHSERSLMPDRGDKLSFSAGSVIMQLPWAVPAQISSKKICHGFQKNSEERVKRKTRLMNTEKKCKECGQPLTALNPAEVCMTCMWGDTDDRTEIMASWKGGETPDWLSNYQVISKIAQGGMGVVYEAVQMDLNRTVALKLISAEAALNSEALARFRREASAIASLNHPNIVDIYEAGEEGGLQYLSMEYLSGGDLQHFTSAKPLGNREAAEIIRQVAAGVDHAHRHGIIHRDIKPQNILLTEDRTHFKVADFGIAKSVESESLRTQTGAVMGSPSYMAPEQAAGRTSSVGPEADVYAIGAVLYFLLTGRPPFRGETPAETMRMVIDEDPVLPGILNPSVDPDLQTICLKCLEKEPSMRYPGVGPLINDLENYLDSRPISARPLTPRQKSEKWIRRNPLPARLALAVFLVGLAGFVGVVYQLQLTKKALAESNRLRIAEATARAPEMASHQILDHQSAVVAAHFDQSGRSIVTSSADTSVRVWTPDSFGKLIPTGLTGHQGIIGNALFFEDGKKVLSFSYDTQTLRPDLGPDGKPVHRTVSHRYGDESVRLWDTKAGTEIWIYNAGTQVSDVALSPDTTQVAVACWDGSLRILDAKSGKPLQSMTPFTGGIRQVEYCPDGQSVIVTHDAMVYNMSLSPNGGGGSISSVYGKNIALRISTRDGSELVAFRNIAGRKSLLGQSASSASVCAVSRDGRWVATGGDNPGNTAIWHAMTGKLAHKLDSHKHSIHSLAFSPDSKLLITASADHTARIWDVSSGRELQILTGHEGPVVDAAFSPDSRRVVTASSDSTARVWDADTGRGISVFRDHGSQINTVRFSPDGLNILTASNDGTAAIFASAPMEDMAGEFRLDQGYPARVGFSNQGKYFFAGSSSGEGIVWETASQNQVEQIAPLSSTALPEDYRHYLFKDILEFEVDDASQSAMVLTDSTSLEFARGILFRPRKFTDVEYTPLSIWNFGGNESNHINIEFDGSQPIGTSAWCPQKNLLAAGTRLREKQLKVYDSLMTSGMSSSTVSLTGPARVYLWSTLDGSLTDSFEVSNADIEFLAFSPDGEYLICNDHNSTQIRSTQNLHDFRTLDGLPARIENIQFLSGHGAALVYGSGAAVILDLDSGKVRENFKPHRHIPNLRQAVLAPRLNQVVCTSYSNTIYIFDPDSGELVREFSDFRTGSGDMDMSPDGRYLAVVGNEKTIFIYNLNDGALMNRLRGHKGEVTDIEFSPDSQWLISGSEDGSIRLWPTSPMHMATTVVQ